MFPFSQFISVGTYVMILLVIGFCSHRNHKTASDFIIGSRSLNFYLTAFSAHASDMSNWLFMAFPASIYLGGVLNAWFGIGLTLFMFLNWIIVAPRLRKQTEKYDSSTLSSFFESRFQDPRGLIRIFTALMSFVFYSVYICAGITGFGLLLENLFNIPPTMGMVVGIVIIIPYLCIAGYTTLAWLDLFQALFLMIVIVAVPLIILPKVGSFGGISTALDKYGLSSSLVPDLKLGTLWKIFINLFGWGLGYFGQPHIITKFMGIRKVKEMRKSMLVGVSWQIIIITAATFIGLVALAYFQNGIENPESAFILMVKNNFPLIIGSFILCAVLAATMSTMDSQILVLASILTEDFYKKIFRKSARSKELLWISRLFVVIVTSVAFLIALFTKGTIYSIVFYAWTGLGSSFGPLILFSLYSKRVNRHGAWAGILVGGGIALFWPLLKTGVSSLIPGFLLSSLAIWILSKRRCDAPQRS